MPVNNYNVAYESMCIGGVALRVRTLKDRQQFFDPQGVAAALGISSAMWPIFGIVWPSARVLATHLDTLVLGGRRILEIGCGIGLASLVAHQRGADVTASDHHPLAATFLHRNTDINGMRRLKFHRADWSATNPDLGRYDLIIGSDVLYERWHPAQAARMIGAHANPDAEVIIVDPRRGNQGRFDTAMAKLGYVGARTAVEETVAALPYSGRIVHYRNR